MTTHLRSGPRTRAETKAHAVAALYAAKTQLRRAAAALRAIQDGRLDDVAKAGDRVKALALLLDNDLRAAGIDVRRKHD